MAAEFITTDQTAQYVIDATDHVALMAGVSLTMTSLDPGFLAAHDGAFTLSLLGTVLTHGAAVSFGATATATTPAYVSVASTGFVQAFTGAGILAGRDDALIENYGRISAGLSAIELVSGVSSGRVVNEGVLTSSLWHGISVKGQIGGIVGEVAVTNTGFIQAGKNGIEVNDESLRLTNSGSIIGTEHGVFIAADAGGLNELTLVNTGLIQGGTAAIDGADLADVVTNAGRLIGDVDLNEGDNRLTGLAGSLIDGDLVTGAGADAIVNDGQVTGSVDLGAGSNDYRGAGDIGGDFSTGAGADTLRLAGTLGGLLDSGDGADVLELSGVFLGDVTAGAGDDLVRVDAGAEAADITLDGGAGSDTLRAFADLGNVTGFEQIWLRGTAPVEITADNLASMITGNGAANMIAAGGGNDDVRGRRGADEIYGDDGDDTLRGNLGDDFIFGGDGADTLLGGYGRDTLVGGAGTDVLSGGRGADLFVFETIGDMEVGALRDRITDFDKKRDMIDLGDLADVTLVWRGTDKFSKGATPEVRWTKSGKNAIVHIDIDGDNVTDGQILIEGVKGYNAGDFIL